MITQLLELASRKLQVVGTTVHLVEATPWLRPLLICAEFSRNEYVPVDVAVPAECYAFMLACRSHWCSKACGVFL